MKKIIITICVIALMLIPSVLSDNVVHRTKISIESDDECTTLITQFGLNDSTSCVIEVDMEGNIIWEKCGLRNPHDAERLPNGNTIIAENGLRRVIEVDRNGDVVWEQRFGLILPMDAERLSNGNTIISDFIKRYVIEVDSNGTIVWNKTDLPKAFDAERLSNGNTLIVEAEQYPDGRIVEVDSEGNELWNMTGFSGPVDVEKLINESTGNITYLITEHVGRRVFEIDEEGTIIWEKTGLLMPSDAERLPNGNTLIAECGANRVIEINENGKIVWVKGDLNYPVDVERLCDKQPPSIEIIKPEQGYLYLRGIPMFKALNRTIVYGPIKIQANATSSGEVERVEFFINNKLKKNVNEEPYEFKWAPLLCGRYSIKAIVYDNTGQNATDSINVFKWRAHPILILSFSLLILGIVSQG